MHAAIVLLVTLTHFTVITAPCRVISFPIPGQSMYRAFVMSKEVMIVMCLMRILVKNYVVIANLL